MMAQPTAPKRQLRPTTSLPSTAEHYGDLHGLDPELQARLQNVGRKGRQGECGVASRSSAGNEGGEGTGQGMSSVLGPGGDESEVQGRRWTEEERIPRRKGYRGGSEKEEIPTAEEVMPKDDTDEYLLICIIPPQKMESTISTNASREICSQALLRCRRVADALTQRSAKDDRSTAPSHSPHSAPTTCPASPPHKPSCTRRVSSGRTKCANASCGRTRPTRVLTRWRFLRGVGARVRGLPLPPRAGPRTGWGGD